MVQTARLLGGTLVGRIGMRVLAGATAVLVTAALLVACAPAQATGTGTVDVRAGQDATLTAGLDHALIVDVPGSSISGDGKLTASQVEAPDGTPGWSIELTGGAELVGPAILQFKHSFEDGEPLPLVASTADGATYELAEEVAVSEDGVTVTTTHFSNWFTMWWGDLMQKARKQLDAIYQDAGEPPSCKNEDAVREAGYSVNSDSGNRVYWCLGEQDGGAAGLKVVNGRGYTVAAEHTPGLAVTAGGPSDLIGVISNIVKETPSLPQNTVTLAGPGSTIEYGVSGSSNVGVRVQPSVAGYLVTAAQYAIDTLAMILPYAGKSGMSKLDIAKLFKWESCLSGYSNMTTGDIQTATQASNYFSDAVGTTLGCLDDALIAAGLSFWGTTVASSLSWLIAGIRTALNGFGAAADTALSPSGYSIYISPPAPAISDESVGELLIPAGACTAWDHTRPIQLVGGQGENFDETGSGIGVLTTRLIGATDLTGDGAEDAVLIIRCTGTPAAQCCVGRGSTLATVIALDLSRATPALIGNPISGGTLSSSEGDVGAVIYDNGTDAPVLDGTDILTYEGPLYDLNDPSEAEQISGWFRHTLVGAVWNRTSD